LAERATGDEIRLEAARVLALQIVNPIDRRSRDRHRRTFGYSTVYLDSPGIRCFVDHVEDPAVALQARSTVACRQGLWVLEVKLKRSGDETDKRRMNKHRG
jgi:VTC domain-containing protein